MGRGWRWWLGGSHMRAAAGGASEPWLRACWAWRTTTLSHPPASALHPPVGARAPPPSPRFAGRPRKKYWMGTRYRRRDGGRAGKKGLGGACRQFRPCRELAAAARPRVGGACPVPCITHPPTHAHAPERGVHAVLDGQPQRLHAQQHQALKQRLAQARARRALVQDHGTQLAVVSHQHELQ